MRIKHLFATLVLGCVLAATGTVVAQETFGTHGEKDTAAQRPFVDPDLKANLQARGTATSLVYLRESADLSPAFDMGWDERGWFVYNTLKEVADRSQAAVKSELDAMGADYRSFWIDNVIAVHNTDNQILSMLASRPDVARVIQEPVGFIPEPPANLTNDDNQIMDVVDSLAQINVPDVWGLGFTGQGTYVGIIDSGTRYTHEALVGNYRGNLGGGSFDHNYNWFDDGGSTEPQWPNPHGTHVTGTAVGDDGADNQIGAAPDAEWVSCLGCTSTSCPGANLLACAEFMAAPTDLQGNNPDPSLRVHVVNNSWGDCGQSYDNWYQGAVDGWIAAGVVPIISNGNAGNCGYSSPPGPNTVGNPARYGSVLGIGSSGNSNGQYANHSNWGPTDNPNDGTDPALPDPMGYPDLKPNVIAPGVSICSSVSSGDSAYSCAYTGTSMSAPAATGVIALMVSAAPSLAGDFATLGTVLMETATPIDYDSGVGGEGPGNVPNYATGWGEIDALAAVQGAMNAAGPRGTLTGTVTDLDTSNPIAGVTVSTEDFESPPNPIETTTDAAGGYSLSLPETEAGESYDIEFSRNGYQTFLATDLTIEDDEIITLDVDLEAVAGETVSGQVTDANFPGTGIEGASLMFTDEDDFTYGPATTDGSGNYSIDLPPGLTYDVSISAEGYETLDDSIGEVTGPTTADFTLNAGVVELPATASLTLDRGTQDSTTVTVNNTGTADAEVTLGFTGTGPVLTEDFEGAFPPSGWTLVDNSTPGPCPWTTTDDTSVVGWSGTARAAAADSDACGSGQANDTVLVSPSIDLSAGTTATLNYDMALRTGFDPTNLSLEVSTNGGSSWDTIDTWGDGDDVAYPGSDFEAQSYDLSAYAGESDVQVRWRYQAGWSYWVIVDNVEVVSDAAGVPWAAVDPATVTVPQGGSVDVDLLVDASDLAAGVYNIPLEVVSGSAYAVTPTDFEVTVDPVPEIILPETVDITVEYPNSTAETVDIDNIGGVSGDVTLDFVPSGIDEDFEGTFPPEGWTLVDESSPACPWSTTDQTTPPGWPAGGTRAAIADSDDCGSGIQADTALISPPVDLSTVTGSIDLDFDFAYRSGFEASTVTLLVSGDGGDTWDVIDSWTDGDDVAYPDDPTAPLSYDLGAYAGQSEVLIQWHYEAGWSWWTIVDNVQIQPPAPTWASANPSLVTVPANDTAQTDIEVDSSVLPGPGTYLASMNGSVDSPFAVDSTLVTLNVEPGADLAGINGTVESLGYCGNDPAAAAGASIEIVGVNNTYNTTADEDGFYEIFIPSDETPVDITASAPNHLDGTETAVVLVPADSITVDFDLDLDEPCVDATPTSFSSTLEIGNSDTQTLTLANTDGAGQLDWTLEEAEPSIVVTDHQGQGNAGAGVANGPSGASLSLVDAVEGEMPSIAGVQPLGMFDCEGGSNLVIADDGTIENGYSGATTFTEVTEVQAFQSSGDKMLGWVCVSFLSLGPDTRDFEIVVFDNDGTGGAPGTELGSVAGTATGIPTGLPDPGDPITWYALDLSSLEIQVADGATVYVGARWGISDPNVFLASDEDGPGGNTGYFRVDAEPWSELGVDAFPEYSALFVRPQLMSPSGCASPSDVSWLSYSSTSGSIPGGGSEDVDVVLDSTGLSPGTYEASICVNSNDPENPIVAVPVTLEATAPGSFASVSGTVQSLGYCSEDPSAAAGASIEIVSGAQTYNLTADGSGFYELFLDSAEGPVDVTATAPDHDVQTVSNVELTAGENEVVDFDLILQAACASAAPESLSMSLEPDDTDSQMLTLANDGGAEFTWSIELEEIPEVFAQGTTDVVEDGSFEDGTPNGFWDESSDNFGTPLCDETSCGLGGGTGPRTGAWWTWFGGIADAEAGAVSQEVTIPSSPSAELRFWLEIPADGQPGEMEVSLGGDVLFSVTEGDAGSYPSYTEVVLDVTSYADGGTYLLEFSSETQAGGAATNFFVDDVSLVAQPGPTDCADPQGVSWLSVDPATGTVAADSTEDVTVTYDSTGVAEGDYQANVCLETSDSEAELIVIPVEFSVFSDLLFQDRFEGTGVRSSDPEDALRKNPN